MKYKRFLLPFSFLAAMTALEVCACGPYMPVSYFPAGNAGVYHVHTKEGCAIEANRFENGLGSYCVTPHLGYELALIGAHYYPAWTGKAPKSNRVSTCEADEVDFSAAGAAAGVLKATIQEDWERFTAFASGVCKRLENGETLEVPRGVPDYALEFYLYKLGHAEWLVFRKDEDPVAFAKLLALPKERRLYRTVWVHFVRIANARGFTQKDRHLHALRQALDAGFKDTAGLEAFALRFLSHTGKKRYDPLVLTAYAQTDWKDWPRFAQRIFHRWFQPKVPVADELKTLCADQIGVEVALAYGAGGHLLPGTVSPKQPALGADRQAWIAFHHGDVALARKLLAMAPEESLIRLFLEARLARLDGDYDTAAERLHRWLAEYRKKGKEADESVAGYRIRTWNADYWLTRRGGKYEDAFFGDICYTGRFGPSDDCYSFRSHFTPQSSEPRLARVVSGELGTVQVATRDLEEALSAFLFSRNWIDVAFVAERCMTVDELVKFMRGSRVPPQDWEHLCDLLMRRLIRCGRLAEATTWAPPKLRPLCDEFCSLSRLANDVKADADTRAVAFFNLSRLTATRGMELMGTELRPDVAMYGGCYARDDIPLVEPVDLPLRLGMKRGGSRWDGWKAPDDRAGARFHYRWRALGFAQTAARLAKSADVRAWSLMWGGVVAMTLPDVPTQDRFYKDLARLRHPRAKVGTWFDTPEFRWFRDEYYDKERHLKPLRVPPRFTKEQFETLCATP